MTVNDLVYISTAGYFFADYPTFLAWLQDQYRGIYGADVYLEADSQDGQFLAVIAQALYDTAALGAAVFNSFSPVTAQGAGLARLVKINGLTKQSPTNSTVDITIVGQAGTTITNGVVQDTLQQKWNVPSPTVIPGGGSIVVTAVAQEIGAVAAAPSTVTTIFTPTLGWQTVNNVAAATQGAAVETDAGLRIRQALSTANPSLTVLDGTTGGISNLSGVQKVRAYENPTGSTDANSIPAHSICMVVVGGDSMAIAQEIALHKTPGTGTYGTTPETVYDAHGMPLVINFDRATPASIQVVVTIAAGIGWSSDFAALIQQSIANTLNADRIGDTVLITKLYAPAYLLGTPPGSTFTISSLTIGKNGGMQGTSNISLTFNENPTCDPAADVTVIVT